MYFSSHKSTVAWFGQQESTIACILAPKRILNGIIFSLKWTMKFVLALSLAPKRALEYVMAPMRVPWRNFWLPRLKFSMFQPPWGHSRVLWLQRGHYCMVFFPRECWSLFWQLGGHLGACFSSQEFTVVCFCNQDSTLGYFFDFQEDTLVHFLAPKRHNYMCWWPKGCFCMFLLPEEHRHTFWPPRGHLSTCILALKRILNGFLSLK